jgi:hypothetical protein
MHAYGAQSEDLADDEMYRRHDRWVDGGWWSVRECPLKFILKERDLEALCCGACLRRQKAILGIHIVKVDFKMVCPG